LDFQAFERALSSYVVKRTEIEDVFTIVDKLGRGAFGYVVLAQLKQEKSLLSKIQADLNKCVR
jgi:hypothetical protein